MQHHPCAPIAAAPEVQGTVTSRRSSEEVSPHHDVLWALSGSAPAGSLSRAASASWALSPARDSQCFKQASKQNNK